MKTLIPLTLSLALIASTGSAASLSFSGSSTGDFSIGVEQFDPSLGTLTQVSYSVLGGALVEELRDFDFGEMIQFEVFTSGTLTFNGASNGGGGFQNVDDGLCNDVGGCQGFGFATFAAQLDGFLDAGFDDLSPFVGTDVLTATLTAERGTPSLQYNIQYTFDPAVVPLPASLPLALAGLGVFGVLRRKQKNRA